MVRLSAAVSYGFQDYDLDRVIPFGGVAVSANGDANGDLFGAVFEASYNLAPALGIGKSNDLRLAPVVGFQFGHADRDGFTELVRAS